MSTRLNNDQVKVMMLFRAMTDLARLDEFRQRFVESLKDAVVELELAGGYDEQIRLARRWVTFCAVAPAIFARGMTAWKGFVVSHMTGIEKGGPEEQMLLSCWADCYDPSSVMEQMMEAAEAGEMDENELVREGDVIKALHAQREESEARLKTFLASRG